MLREGIGVAGLGIAIGLLASVALTRAVSALLFQVSAMDVTTFVGLSVLLLVIAALAQFVPARRAARVDPRATMRGD